MNKSLKNRVQTCVCGSGKNTTECCLALLEGVDLATSAEQLMRSRYTAYVLGNDEYLLQSWHLSSRPQALNLENTLQWCGLKVLNVSPENDTASANNTAYVEFVAAFIDTNASVSPGASASQTGQMHERSRFLFEDGRWFYVDGEQIEAATQYNFSLPGRNDPCYCASGKKFKKCCGKKSG